MAYSVGDEKEVALLLTFIECMVFISEDRAEYNYVGDQILPARSALEMVRETLDDRIVQRLNAFDAFARAHHDAFNTFFAYEHAQADRATALEDWVWSKADGKTPTIPAEHWWWAPISAGGAA